jgi:hypothetical protein
MTSNAQDPIGVFEWNEGAVDRRIENGIFSIVAKDRAEKMQPVGTGFFVSSGAHVALAISAAHVFSYIRDLQQPVRPAPHPSLPPDFAPISKPLELEIRDLTILYTLKETQEFGKIKGLAFDEKTDVAIMQIVNQYSSDEKTDASFGAEFLLDDRLPLVGELVCIFSYLDLSSSSERADEFQVTRRPVIRVGRVTNVFPDGHGLTRGPCVETTIPVYFGMSGGPAMHYDETGSKMRVFGFVTSDLDEDSPRKQDRSIAGRSIISKIPCESIDVYTNQQQVTQLKMTPTTVVGDFILTSQASNGIAP